MGVRGRRPKKNSDGTATRGSSVQKALNALLSEVRYSPPKSRGHEVRAPGHYAGLWKVGRETLAITTDTVGTKVLLAAQLREWAAVGEDLVAINVNDLASVGARPAAIVDVISCPATDPAVFREIGRGINRGLEKAGCALLGGESAVVPDLLRATDLGATAVGFFPRQRSPVLGNRIRPGDRILGIPSSGFHSNGFTLIRRIIDAAHIDVGQRRTGGRWSLGTELLEPTRTYVSASEALADLPGTTGFAHVSGGGIRNLARLNGRARFLLDQWPKPSGLFDWVAEAGKLAPSELFQTFNMGVGFFAVVRPGSVETALRRLTHVGVQDAVVVGSVDRGGAVELPEHGIRFEGYR